MKTESWFLIFEFIIGLVILVAATMLVLSAYGNAYGKQQLETFDKCCNGSPCSDTYWNGTACVYTMGQDTNFIPFITNWWMVIVSVGVAVILVIVIQFIVPREMKE